ncbi:major facilitator superfamily domain-containing protein [Gigaspora rosea]|uniref:Major facilitator superfamily domain-containing protein n=1 Tax=Gigaspora rosea TaxID=44941 RepID=A0A397VDE6_9GLOM|nr:major facilitator superfamily domain-containing protein [Gigaspora rosea]
MSQDLESNNIEKIKIKEVKTNGLTHVKAKSDYEDISVNDNIDNDEIHTKLTEFQFFFVFLGLCFAMFMAALDQTVVTTAIPKIVIDLNSVDKIVWIGTAYLLTATSFQPVYGKLADIFGRKITFLIAMLLFELGSILCGVSSTMIMLIISRSVAGLGGGGIFGMVLIILADIVSVKDRGKYQGIIGAVFIIASIISPVIGGLFTDNNNLGWRWAFYINVPIGFVSIICILFFFKSSRTTDSLYEKFKRIDWLGSILITCSIMGFLIPLSWGGVTYPWNSPIIISLLIVGVLLLALFIYVEGYVVAEPLAPGRLFKDRSIVACYSVNFCLGMIFFSVIYFLPLYFEIVNEDSATMAGVKLLPYIAGSVITVLLTGLIVSNTTIISYKLICIFGGILTAVGIGLISLFNINSTMGEIVGYLLISGLGAGAVIQTVFLAGQASVKYEDVAAVTSLITFFRTIGAVFGLGIVAAVFASGFSSQIKAAKSVPDLLKIYHQLPEFLKEPTKRQLVSSISLSFKTGIAFGLLLVVSAVFIKDEKKTKATDKLLAVFSRDKKSNVEEVIVE